MLLAALGFFVAVLTVPSIFGMFAGPSRTQQLYQSEQLQTERSLTDRLTSKPIIRTDRQGYLAGETITITGEGFSPLESVMLRVAHDNGTQEADMGHEPWWVYADANGAFETKWSVDLNDTSGVNLVLVADGSSGSKAQEAFGRIGALNTDRFSVRGGERTRITAEGFGSNELVTIGIQGGHEPITTLSDQNGRVTADIVVPDDQRASSFSIAAMAENSGVVALTVINSGWFVITDTGGPNDQPGQVDLTQMGRRDDDATFFKLLWSWDSISAWTGTGQTGDACALFDTNNNQKIDYAVCVRVANPNANPAIVNILPAAADKPAYLWKCTDGKNDRCTQPTAQTGTYTVGQVLAGPWNNATTSGAGNLILDADPFPAGESYQNDSVVEVWINKSVISGPENLVNVCSYPSAGSGGNNNPFDCILPPGDGLLKITKNAGGNTTQDFTFTVSSPAPSAPQPATYTIKGGGFVSNIGVNPTATAKVTETIPATWKLDGATCTLEGGTDDPVSVNTTTGEVSGIEIQTGKLTTCTFNDSRQTGTLTVIKHVVNDNGGTATANQFTYALNDGSGLASETGAESPGKVYTRSVGTTYNVVENAGGPAGYTVSYSADCTAGTIQGGTIKTCTITNNDDAGSLTIVKRIINDNGGTKVVGDFGITTTAGALTFGAGAADGANTLKYTSTTLTGLSAGSKTLHENVVAGYTEGTWTCVGSAGAVNGNAQTGSVVLALGESVTCTITNDDNASSPLGTTIQSWRLFDSATFTILAGAGDKGVAGKDEVTFKLYKVADGTVNANSCTGLTPVHSETVKIQNGGVENGKAATVSGYLTSVTGTYAWVAEFSGDQFNSTAATTCSDEVTVIGGHN